MTTSYERKMIDYDIFDTKMFPQKEIKLPKKRKYCVVSSLDSKERVYVLANSVSVTQDGTLLFTNEMGDVVLGVNAFKYSLFFVVNENNVPIDVFGDNI